MESWHANRGEGIDLEELFRTLRRRARWILWITAAATVAATVVSLLLPKYYRAETWILPPKDKGGSIASQLLGQSGGLIALAGSAAGLKSQGDLYVEMVKSRTVLDRIVDRYDLLKLYRKRFRQDARRKLLKSITVRADQKSGIILLTVEDRDPKRASDMANSIVEELRSLTGGLAISEAGQRRLYFEDQIRHTKESLTRAEEEIRDFQQRTGLFQIDAQGRAIIEGIARLRAGIAVKEVEAKVLRSFATDRNPDLQRVEEEISALRVELTKMETRKGNGFDPLMSSGRVPEAGVEYFRKLRQLKYHETLFELLSKQFELAKLEEGRDAAVIQVIDRAVPPERKSSPKRALIVLLAMLTALFLSSLWVLFLERQGKKPGSLPAGEPAATEFREG